MAGSAIELRIKATRGDTSSMIEIQTLQPLTLNIILRSSFIIVYLSTIYPPIMGGDRSKKLGSFDDHTSYLFLKSLAFLLKTFHLGKHSELGST